MVVVVTFGEVLIWFALVWFSLMLIVDTIGLVAFLAGSKQSSIQEGSVRMSQSQPWWHTCVIPVPGLEAGGHHEVKASLGYKARPVSKKQKQRR